MINGLFDLVSLMVARFRNQEGQTMAEYGILIAVIALVVIVAAAFLGTSLTNLFSNTASRV